MQFLRLGSYTRVLLGYNPVDTMRRAISSVG